MGNSQAKKRIVKVNSIYRRLSKQEKQQLKDAFDRLQDRQVINDQQFRNEVLGPQVPESISLKFLQLFSSEESATDSLNYEDLLAFYLTFRKGRPEELGQVFFEILRMSSTADYLSREHISVFVDKLDTVNDQQIQQFYAKTEFDPRLPIKRDDFVQAFKKVHQLPLFTWLHKFIEGFNRTEMNVDEISIRQASTFHKQLTTLSQEKAKNETESLGFTSDEHNSMQEFFNKEIKKSDAKEVLSTIQLLFKDVKSSRLKRYFIETLTKHKVLDYTYLTSMVQSICKETAQDKKLEFLFDIFSQHTDTMKRKQMRDFAEIFKLGANFFQARGQSLTKQEFIEDTTAMDIDLSVYEQSRYIIIALMGLKPKDDQEEREAILAALNQNHNVEGYIQENLETENTYYIIEKEFYEAWAMNNGFIDDKSYIIKKEKINTIDNAQLIEPYHEMRMKDDHNYGDKFIVVPKYVFFPLSKWYKTTKVIERKVINYHSDKKKSLSLFKQKTQAQSRIIAGSSQTVPEAFFKTIGEVTYELEIYPKHIYYERINDKGERPHQKAVVNQKVDPNYMKKTLKSDKLPFQEMLGSRKQTFEDILKDISATFKENHKRGRLWIEDQVISGAKLEMTLEEYGLAQGQVIYVEYANQNNQWPTDKVSAAPQSGNKLSTTSTDRPGQPQRVVDQKTSGLYNLGNTCYMNSALQCLANTKFFHEYFIKEKLYMKQMNIKNKFGHQGELASSFAQLIQKMYLEGGRVVIPKEFKASIAQISEQFAGYEQQDSQEFLFFLLEGLHEELNLRLEKPYIENPDSDDRKIVELGLESWSNTLRRDWSFILFMFYGQLKSTLNCLKCNKISTTFDIFTNIPLSLPEPSKILINVVIYRLPNEIKDMISGLRPQSMMKRVDSAKSDVFERNPSQIDRHPDRHPSTIFKIQETLKYATNDQPIHIALRVDKDAKISQIIQEICEVKEVNIEFSMRSSNLVLFSQIKGIIRGIFNPELRLSNYNLINNEIEAIEVLNSRGREMIRDFYQQNENLDEVMKTMHLSCLLKRSHRLNNQERPPVGANLQNLNNGNVKPTASSTSNNSIKGRKRGQQQNNQSKMQQEQQKPKMDKCQLFNNFNFFIERYQDFEDNDEIPDEIYVVAYHRRFVKKQYFFFNPYQPQILGTPIIFILPRCPTGRRVYEEVWAVAQNILKKSSIYHNMKNLWWEQANWRDKFQSKENTPQDQNANLDPQQFKPFVLKVVDRFGFNCIRCSWMQICSGCMLPPSDDFIEAFPKYMHLAIEWNSQVLEDDYNPQANEVRHHSSTQDKEIIDEDQVNLEDCLRKFHEVEEISEKELINCSTCQSPQSHLKKLEIFRPPPILIVQLKRFKFNNQSRNKLNTYVEFPLYNLDVSTFVTDADYLSTSGIEQRYDLYAMINHYGNLSFGHYISVVKNYSDGKWYKYDDSARIPIPEEQLQKDFAYILFYVRKDLQSKQFSEVVPNIKDLFPGKPIKTEAGQAFVINAQSTNQYLIQYEKGKSSELVQKDQILEEADNNELVFDAKDIEEIEKKRKEKLIEKAKQGKTKKRSCLFCSTSLLLFGSPKDGIKGSGKHNGRRKRTLKQSIANTSGMNQCGIF